MANIICTWLFYQLSRACNSQGWGSNEVNYTERSLERTENLSKTCLRELEHYNDDGGEQFP